MIAWLTLLLLAGLIGYAVWPGRAAPGPSSSQPSPSQPAEDGDCPPATADGIPQQPGTAEPLPEPATARAALATLRVASRAGGDTYCRGRFGPPTWPDLDRNGCSTRQDVLVRQAQQVRTARIAAHDRTCAEAMAGTWIDPYTGAPITLADLKDPAQAQQLQIDHLVPLYNAWVSGASGWTDERRVIFANDLAAPELRAVAGAVNFAKDRSGPDSWQPVPAARCDYARAFVAVKAKYDLSVTAAERTALTTMLATCP